MDGAARRSQTYRGKLARQNYNGVPDGGHSAVIAEWRRARRACAEAPSEYRFQCVPLGCVADPFSRGADPGFNVLLHQAGLAEDSSIFHPSIFSYVSISKGLTQCFPLHKLRCTSGRNLCLKIFQSNSAMAIAMV